DGGTGNGGAEPLARAPRILRSAGENGHTEDVEDEQNLDAEEGVVERRVAWPGEQIVSAGQDQAGHGGEHDGAETRGRMLIQSGSRLRRKRSGGRQHDEAGVENTADQRDGRGD